MSSATSDIIITLNAKSDKDYTITSDFDQLIGTRYNDRATLNVQLNNADVDLKDGNADVLSLGDFVNTGTVKNTETINGNTKADTLTVTAGKNAVTIDLKDDSDSVTLGGKGTYKIGNVESIVGSNADDAVIMTTKLTQTTVNGVVTNEQSIDLGGGKKNSLTLADSGNMGAVKNVQTLTGGSGDDKIGLLSVAANADKVKIDLKDGNADTLYLADGNNFVTVNNAEFILGNNGADKVTLGAAYSIADPINGFVDLGAGSDTLVLGAFNNVISVQNVEKLTGGSKDDAVTFAAVDLTKLDTNIPVYFNSVDIDLGAGNNTIVFYDVDYNPNGTANYQNYSGIVKNAKSITGSKGNETLIVGDVKSGTTTTIDLGAGTDSVTLGKGTYSVGNVEEIKTTGNNVGQTVTLTSRLTQTTTGNTTSDDQFVDLGTGRDTLTLANGGNVSSVRGVEILYGGDGGDLIDVATVLLNGDKAEYDLKDGEDHIWLANGSNVLTAKNIEHIDVANGSTGNDKVTYGSAFTASSDIDLGEGSDVLVLGKFANAGTVKNVEKITGDSGNFVDAITYGSAVTDGNIDLGGGSDSLTFKDGVASSAAIKNVETVTGGTGAETLTVTASTLTANTATTIDLKGGADSVTLTGKGPFKIGNVEEIKTTGNDGQTVTLTTNLTQTTDANNVTTNDQSVNLGGGKDTLVLNNGDNAGLVSGVETLTGASGNDVITLGTVAANADGVKVDLKDGNGDKLTLADGANFITVSNTETIEGGTGDDKVTLGTALDATMTIDLKGGTDTLVLGKFANTGTVSNVEKITGDSGNYADAITYGSAVTSGNIDLGGGTDSLTFKDGVDSTATVKNVETITGGTGGETLTVAALTTGTLTVNGGGGTDALTLTGSKATVTVTGVESITATAGIDTITFGAALSGTVTIDGGGANDVATLFNGINTGTLNLTAVEALNGGTSDDTITLGSVVTGLKFDGKGGTDKLILANGTNSITTADVDTVVGGTGGDTVVGTGNAAATYSLGGGVNVVTGGTGGDTFVFDQTTGTDTTKVMNMGTGDKIMLDTDAGGSTVYDLNGVGLVDGTTIAMVDDAAARNAHADMNSGKGAFLYQKDTGELYYSATGVFSGSAEVLVGTITTNGTAAWTYSASAFVAG